MSSFFDGQIHSIPQKTIADIETLLDFVDKKNKRGDDYIDSQIGYVVETLRGYLEDYQHSKTA